MHHWLIKDTKNQVSNIVSSCRYEHQEMGQISGGKRGSLALTVSDYNTVLYTLIFLCLVWKVPSNFQADISTGRYRRHRHSGISVCFRSIPVSGWIPLLWYRTGSRSAFLLRYRYRPNRIPDSPAFWKLYEGGRKSSWTSALRWWKVISDIWCFKIITKCRNAGEKVIPATAYMPSVNWLSLASAFQRQGQPRTAGHGFALPSFAHLYFRHLHWYGSVTVLLLGWVILE